MIPVAAAITAALGTAIVGLVVRALVGIGFTIVAYVGISTLWDTVTAGIWSNLSGAGASILSILVMARVDDAMQVVLSAGFSVITWRGLAQPILKRLTLQ